MPPSPHPLRDNFLAQKLSVTLPSNLLTAHKTNPFPRTHTSLTNSRHLGSISKDENSTKDNGGFVGEKFPKDKEVLYKRLNNIRGQNKEVKNLSFSKMLSRMVVFDDD